VELVDMHLLAERGYSVTGNDRSDAFIAEEKARKIKGSAEFSGADIRDFDLNKKFDGYFDVRSDGIPDLNQSSKLL
jgi:2-polyprenyl-3-methyl-5-hydroxy-6-metoxy-1,4-benzoquinol methylase